MAGRDDQDLQHQAEGPADARSVLAESAGNRDHARSEQRGEDQGERARYCRGEADQRGDRPAGPRAWSPQRSPEQGGKQVPDGIDPGVGDPKLRDRQQQDGQANQGAQPA